MAIVMTIDTSYELQTEFNRYDRSENFTPAGVRVLFDYLEEISEGSGEDIKLDIIGLCCEYYESSIEEIIDHYKLDVSHAEGDEDEIKEMVREYLEDRTSVCGEVSDGFVYAAF